MFWPVFSLDFSNRTWYCQYYNNFPYKWDCVEKIATTSYQHFYLLSWKLFIVLIYKTWNTTTCRLTQQLYVKTRNTAVNWGVRSARGTPLQTLTLGAARRDGPGSLVWDISLQRILSGVKPMKWIIWPSKLIYEPAFQLTFASSCNHEWSFIFYL